jgi:type IV pilus assembly protein PilM
MNPTLGWGCEISPSGVCLARWDGSSSGLGASAWRPLSEGAVEVSPLRENLLRADEVERALSGCLDSLGRSNGLQSGGRTVDVALVIPDQAARVFFLSFDSFPSKAAQAIPLVRWKLKKSVPFDIETSAVSYLATRGGGEWRVLAVVSPEIIVRQYERLAESLGLKPRFVTLSTLGCLGLLPSDEAEQIKGRFLVVKYSPPWLTTAIVHEGSVRLFRTVSIGSGSGLRGTASEEALQEILESIHPSVAYFQDNFGMPLEAAFLSGLGEYTEAITDSLTNELHLPARALLRVSAPPAAGWDSLDAERHLAALSGIARVRRRG